VGKEHEGLRIMFIMMNHARLAVGLEGVAMAERAYQQALGYARTRVQGRALGQASGERVPILQHPDVRRMLLCMKAQTEAMRALAYTAAGALDLANHHPDDSERARSQALVDLLTPIVKGWCTEQAVEIASLGLQVHGGMGFIEETGAAHLYRDARITPIYEGTTGIQALDLVGRKVASERGATMLAALAEASVLAGTLQSAADEPVLHAIAAQLRTGIEALEQATRWVVETYAREPQLVAAVCVPYLKLAGTVLGGDAMARSARIAAERIAAGRGDLAFYRAKLRSARFYSEHVLPQSLAYAQTVVRGAASVVDAEAAAL
jgi:hypothetical protein